MNKETITEKVNLMGSVYSNTIVEKISNEHPNLNKILLELIKELSMNGFIDGANAVLTSIED